MECSGGLLQEVFNPVDYGFSWTSDWYEWDYQAGHDAAKKARNVRAEELKADGYKVNLYTLKNQLITRGGIGSGHPQIEHVVTCYMLMATPV